MRPAPSSPGWLGYAKASECVVELGHPDGLSARPATSARALGRVRAPGGRAVACLPIAWCRGGRRTRVHVLAAGLHLLPLDRARPVLPTLIETACVPIGRFGERSARTRCALLVLRAPTVGRAVFAVNPRC